MGCYRNWTHSVPHINTWTVSIHYSSTDSGEKLFPGVDKCLITFKEQSTLTKETRVDKTPSVATNRQLIKRYKKLLLSSFQKQNQRKQLDQYLQKAIKHIPSAYILAISQSCECLCHIICIYEQP